MTEREVVLITQWKEADQAAREAERALSDAYEEFLRGSGPAPAGEERDATHALRKRANDLLSHAISALDRARCKPE